MKENKTTKTIEELAEDFPLYYHLWEQYLDNLWESLQDQSEESGSESTTAFFNLYTQTTGEKANALMFLTYCAGVDRGIDLAEMLREDAIEDGKITTMALSPGERELLLAYRQTDPNTQHCIDKILDCFKGRSKTEPLEITH